MKFFPTILFFSATLSACTPLTDGLTGRSSGGASMKPVNPTLTAELFAARGFLGGTDYEQYKLQNGSLWRECGQIKKKVSNDKGSKAEVLKSDPSFTPVERRIDSPTERALGELSELAEELITLDQSLPAPGSLFSLLEPGLVELNLSIDGKSKRFITSVDSLTDGDGTASSPVREFVKTLRGVGPVICQTRAFYGISRKEMRE